MADEQPFLVLVQSTMLRGAGGVQVRLYDTYLVKRLRRYPWGWRSQRVDLRDVLEVDLQTAAGRLHLSLRTASGGEIDLSGFPADDLTIAAEFIGARSPK